MAASALPGHRLVLEGRGREALRLSALGSASAVLVAVPLAVPLTRAMVAAYPTVRAHLPLVLGGVAAVLVLTEGGVRGVVGGTVSLALAGGRGGVTLPLEPSGPLPGSVLAPLFAGLFGAPVLVEAYGGDGVPPQEGTGLALAPRAVGGLGTLGSAAGAVVGYVPGVSAAVAATVALTATPGRYGARGFVVTTSGVNTATAVFAVFALVALGQPRTGVLVAFERSGAPVALGVPLVAVALAAVVAAPAVPLLGDRYLAAARRVDVRVVSVGTVALLGLVSWLFAGSLGVVVYGVATLVGLVPPALGVRRVHLMGVLLVPLALGL
jgi:putative membrane protein